MSVFILSIEWGENQIPETATLENLLKANFSCAKLTELSYLLSGTNTVVEIRDFITSKLPNLSRVFVGEMECVAAWRNMLSKSEIIKQLFSNE